MATRTSNLDLVMPVGTEHVSRQIINENYQRIDAGFGETSRSNEIGIVVTGNTATLDIATGDYVIVRESTIDGVLDGLYTAENDVAAGTAVVGTDLIAQESGGLNALKNILEKLLDTQSFSSGAVNASRIGKVCTISINGTATIAAWGNVLLATLPEEMRPVQYVRMAAAHDINSVNLVVTISTNGQIKMNTRDMAISNANYFSAGGSFVCNGT